MRLWSLESYKCVEEYSVPDTVPLVDFDFDESKVTLINQCLSVFIYVKLDLNATIHQQISLRIHVDVFIIFFYKYVNVFIMKYEFQFVDVFYGISSFKKSAK